MTAAELFEEIRTLLREAQANTIETPWLYRDMDLIVQIRSAFRYLRTVGVVSLADYQMDETGVILLDDEEDEIEEADGVMVAHLVAVRLIKGDLVQKLASGEVNVMYKAGLDTIDTREASKALGMAANAFSSTFQTLLTISLSGTVNEAASVFGDQEAYEA